MSFRPYRVVPQMSPGVQGSSMARNTRVRRGLDFFIPRARRFLGVPYSITSIPQVEGVDIPFYAPTYLLKNLLQDRRRRRAALLGRWRVKTHARKMLGVSLSILNTAVTPDPFPGKGFIRHRRALNLIKRLRARDAKLRTVGQFYATRPATVYGDDVCRVLLEIRRHMLEYIDQSKNLNPDLSLWTGVELLKSLNQRVSQFLVETGILRQRASIAVTGGSENVDLPTDLIDVRRVVWNTGTARTVLSRVDPFQLDNSNPGWQDTTGVPVFYIEEPLDALTIKLTPVPSANGTVELIYVPLPTQITSCVPMPVPAIFTPYIKYGIMADMLKKEGEANDSDRAGYCEQRFDEGVDLAKLMLKG